MDQPMLHRGLAPARLFQLTEQLQTLGGRQRVERQRRHLIAGRTPPREHLGCSHDYAGVRWLRVMVSSRPDIRRCTATSFWSNWSSRVKSALPSVRDNVSSGNPATVLHPFSMASSAAMSDSLSELMFEE
jgi:hypothetical protein